MDTTPTRSANARHTPKLISIVDEAVHSDRCYMPSAHPRLHNALLQGADPNERAWDGETALSAACVRGADVRIATEILAASRCVAAALIPEFRQRQALAAISEAQRARETALAGSSSSSPAKPSGRSREEADRMAAQLLAEEEAEKAKAQAAQAKKQQKARQRAKAQRVATAPGVEGAEAAGQQQEQGQPGSAGSAGAAATPGAVAGPVAAGAPTSQLAGLTLGSAPAPFAPGPGGTAAQQQQQQQKGASVASQAREDERCCVVCMDRPRIMVLVPCGHVALCQECCDAVQEKHNECPMCRAVIDVAVALNL